MRLVLRVLAVAAVISIGGCAQVTERPRTVGTAGTTGAGGVGGAASGNGGRGGSGIVTIVGMGGTVGTAGTVGAAGTAPKPHICGNGDLTPDEACDDGNTIDGDGCSGDCRTVGTGFSCSPPGKPCRRIARCGDGVVTTPEPCDDGNLKDGDGCSVACRVEIGWKCTGSPSVCSATVCGDGRVEGAEGCDDGNTVPFDGCGSRCLSEPDCTQGACKSRCGDGLVLGEACDDGNAVSGDGCSSSCTVEAGFMCDQDAGCEMLNGKCIVRADAIFRDFTGETTSEHPDFQGCDVLPVVPGAVNMRLDAQAKPVLSATRMAISCIASDASFAQWYRKDATNVEVVGIISLYDNGMGGFVNRYGPNGEPWIDADGKAYDGSPLFFPLDGKGKQAASYPMRESPASACVPGSYGDEPASYVSTPHNFHFTTEVTHWFKYDAAKPATLAFTGDDDVWVFLNGVLAVDIGGVHGPANGSVVVGPTTAAQFGLENGKVYPIKVFQAERRICGSTFKLTLTGFAAGRSGCRPLCGDGIVSLGEECDDGFNDGGYGECGRGCKLTEFCGDGIVQVGHEDCDDGNTIDGDGCPSSCRKLIID